MARSKVMELADAEGTRAEAENPDEDEGQAPDVPAPAEPDTEDEEADAEESEAPAAPEPEQGEPASAQLTIGPTEIRKAERAREAYRAKIAAVLGEAAVAHECVLCAGLGYLADLPPLGTEFTFGMGAEGPELEFRQPPTPPDYRQASDKVTCPECDGYGQTLTGAKAPAQVIWQCSKCAGTGYIMRGEQVATPAALDFQPHPEPAAYNGGENTPGPDAWGRPFGHQHYGVPPAMIAG